MVGTTLSVATTSTAGVASLPVVEQAIEKLSTALQTYYPPNNGFAGVAQQVTLELALFYNGLVACMGLMLHQPEPLQKC